MNEVAALPCAHGPAMLTAQIRQQPEDFQVVEIASFAASGSGEHLLLEIEKRGLATHQVVQRLARWAGVSESAIGYAGLKDRHALTRQRFSIWLPKRHAPEFQQLVCDGLRVLAHDWHARKLPRGALAGNRFVLRLRDVCGDRGAIESRLICLGEQGVPNYFGEQRFGRGGENVARAMQMFAGKRFKREVRSLLISAARSEIFNAVLAERVAGDCWQHALPGDVFMLDGSHSVFGPEPIDAQLAARIARFDIHPTGPMWGQGSLRSTDACVALEQRVADQYSTLCQGLADVGLKQERRSLRLPVRELEWQWLAADVLELCFTLPAGSYATVVLRELGDVRDPHRA